MYFNVYSDTGTDILGYLIPDGFSAKPQILVACDGEVIGTFDCDIFLEGPYTHKHHATGVVGFHLHEGNLPGVTSTPDIEISDAASGLVFYRRLRRDLHIKKRLFRLETQFIPHRELDRSMQRHFQFYAESVEQYGSETVRQMLEIVNQPSTYISGRVLLKSVQQYFTQDSIRITSMRDPFYELAVRLWSVASFKRRRFSFIAERDVILLEPAMSYFADTNFSDPAAIERKIRNAPKEVLALFESPFTHQLAASSPSDRVSRDALSHALDALSQFTLFDPEERDGTLARDISGLLGIDEHTISFSPMRHPFLELSDVLRNLPSLQHVLENDLILFYFIKKARQRSQSLMR